MKITQKNLGQFIIFLLASIVMGTLGWELLEIIISAAGLKLDLSAGPIGFDIDVLAVFIKINPGSFAGAVAGFFLFRKI